MARVGAGWALPVVTHSPAMPRSLPQASMLLPPQPCGDRRLGGACTQTARSWGLRDPSWTCCSPLRKVRWSPVLSLVSIHVSW